MTAHERRVAVVTGASSGIGAATARALAAHGYDVEGRVRIHKRVDYYLMAYLDGSERDSDPREVVAARWYPWDEALVQLSFDNEREVVRHARTLAAEGDR